MFTYNTRLFDRYARPVTSIAVLADRSPGWCPHDFWCEAPGTRLGIEFTAIKLMDFCRPLQGLENNFFALVAQAHFATLNTRRDPGVRLESKLKLTELAYSIGWPERRVLDFNDVLDWMMRLPAPQQATYKEALRALERRFKMPYVNSLIRDAIAEGKEVGRQEGRQEERQEGRVEGRRRTLADLLALRFGDLPGSARLRLESATEDELSRWTGRLLVADRLEGVLGPD